MFSNLSLVLLALISTLVHVRCQQFGQYGEEEELEEWELSDEEFELAEHLTAEELAYGDGMQRINIWENGQPDGDMVRRPQRPVTSSDGVQTSVIQATNRDWPNKVVPYSISKKFNKKERAIIAAAILDFHKHTCVKFVHRKTEADFLYVVKKDGCWSELGRIGGTQELSLGAGCVYKGTIIHEFLHAIGFIHEQNRSDRDSHVNILWNNIRDDAKTQFEKYSPQETTSLGMPYDYQSIMQYDATSFSKNDRPTIESINPRGAKLGQDDGFSALDIKKVNKAYQCQGTNPGLQATTPNTQRTINTYTENPTDSYYTDEPILEVTDYGDYTDSPYTDDGFQPTDYPYYAECYDYVDGCPELVQDYGCSRPHMNQECKASCGLC